ncbi:DNA repair protein RecO [Paenalkalicoccus suaedae]|uniref:DNA repair protein RecO n=1 Tax=Paenalkalicoccus suaedae TaxID=2592382 RepID=A0A859FF57_9BACI|nr:DNA repair protein RecO [Paenalkalicoccus suaedae]QKS70866.1 DNA repair protein RecO [Paenalkalicoccus suaedae]
MIQKVEGIVIRTTDYGETNKILTIYTREFGKVPVMARGAKRPKSRFAASSQLFIQGVFVYQQSKGIGTLTTADIIDSFRGIRSDLMLTAYSAYIVELLDKLTEDREKSPYLYELLYQVLHHINEGVDAEVLVRLVETKLLSLTGSPPILHECARCQSVEEPFQFSIRYAGALCRRCLHEDSYHLRVSPQTMKLLRLFQQLNPTRIGSITLKEQTKRELKEALTMYYQEYVGVYAKSKRFLDQMEKMNQASVDTE